MVSIQTAVAELDVADVAGIDDALPRRSGLLYRRSRAREDVRELGAPRDDAALQPLPQTDRLSWVLADGRAGDDAQLVRIAEALGWPYEIHMAKQSVPAVVRGRLADALGFTRPVPARLQNGRTWPDIVLAAGGRNVSFARQIKAASGGRARLVFLGAPYAALDDFDLIITTAQWRLPARGNVVHNMLPLNWPERRQLDDAASAWVGKLQHLPRPWLAVLVGGSNSSFRISAAAGRQMARRINEVVARTGGSVLLTTSRRTPAATADALIGGIAAPQHVYRWSACDRENPYLGYLALADRFLVTNESASMIADALNSGRPVELFRLPQRAVSRLLTSALIAGADEPDGRQYTGGKPADRLRRWLIDRGFWTPARDLGRLCRMLEDRNLLAGANDPAFARPCDADLERTIGRIHALFGNAPAETTARSAAMQIA